MKTRHGSFVLFVWMSSNQSIDDVQLILPTFKNQFQTKHAKPGAVPSGEKSNFDTSMQIRGRV